MKIKESTIVGATLIVAVALCISSFMHEKDIKPTPTLDYSAYCERYYAK